MVINGEKQVQDLTTNQLFLGEYQPNLTKGARLALPKKIREVFGKNNRIILSRGFEKCIFGFTLSAWENESRKSIENSSSDKRSRMLKRYMFSGAYEVEIDTQGRVVLPKSLLTYSSLLTEKESLLIGAGDHFEIWNKRDWDKMFSIIEGQVL